MTAGARATAQAAVSTWTVLAWITGAWVAVLLAWSVALPVYRSADEANHVSANHTLRYERIWPGYKALPLAREVWVTIPVSGYGDQSGSYYPLPAADAPPRAARPPIAPSATPLDSGAVNPIGQHPPGYYGLGVVVTTFLPAATAFDLHVWALRLLSVLLMAPLPALLAATARRLGADRPAVVTAAVVPFLIPQLGALGGAVNNDNLLILACVSVAYLATRVATGDLRRVTGVAVGFALMAALLAKAWALVFVPVVVTAYAIAAVRARRVRPVVAPALAALTLGLVGAGWWLRNLVVFGSLQPAGHRPLRAEGPLSASEAWPNYARAASRLIPERFWATLSIKTGSPPFPQAFTQALFIVLIGFLVAFVIRRRCYSATRVDALLLTLPFLISLAILVESTWGLYLITGRASGLQGRYLFAGIAGPAMALALGVISALPVRGRRWVAPLLTAAGMVFVGLSLRKVLAFHYEGDGLSEQLSALTAWSPVPPVLSVGLLGLAVLAMATTPIMAAVSLRGPRAGAGCPGVPPSGSPASEPPSRAADLTG